MPHSYGLYPWTWNAAENCHEPPAGAFAVLDLRPLSEQAVAGQSGGWGFFAWPDQVYDEYGVLSPNPYAVPVDLIGLGYGDCRELQPTTAVLNELKIRLGLSEPPAESTLINVINRRVLGDLADPTGQNGPKPNLPTREGVLEIHLAYHSRVAADSFNGGAMFATTATGRANRIRDVLRTDLETANKSGGVELVAKVLGHWCDRWGVSYAQAAKWRNLIRGPLLAELLGKTGGKFAPKKPATSYSDDFNRANGGIAGNWTAVSGTWSIVSNAVQCGTTGVQTARYESDLSSSDHWATLTQTAGGSASNLIFAAVRFDSSANTCYTGDGYSSGFRLSKIIAGTATTLSSVTGVGIDTCETRASGSTISITRTARSDISLTDTSITGNTRCGMGEASASGGTSTVDDWSCDDGVSAGGASRLLLLGVG